MLASLLAVAFFVLVLEKSGVTNFFDNTNKGSDTRGPSPEQQKQEAEANAESKKNFIESGEKNATSPQNSSSSSSQSEKSIELTTNRENNNTLTVFTKLYGFSGGTCKLTVLNGSQTYTQSVALVYQPEHSTCAGFSVPIDKVGKGDWSIELVAESNNISKSKKITAGVQ